MAGHNKWSKIKHRKAVVDKRRGKAWTKCSRAIMSAARQGGGDPDANLMLRYAIDEARYYNMPKDTIERAIQKGVGDVGGDSWEPVRYEAYGPGGVALIIDALTDNRTRTATDLRTAFSRHGGNLGASGCVAYLFDARGQIAVPSPGVDEDRLMESALEAGALDVQGPDSSSDSSDAGAWTVLTAPNELHAVRNALEHAGFRIEQAQLAMVPQNTVEVRGEDARRLLALVDQLEDSDDVQKVHTNADIPDDVLASLDG